MIMVRALGWMSRFAGIAVLRRARGVISSRTSEVERIPPRAEPISPRGATFRADDRRGAGSGSNDIVQEASEQSFPASHGSA